MGFNNMFYGIYFDKLDLKIDRNGHLVNPEVLEIIEFDEDGNVIRRVDQKGQTVSEVWENEDFRDDLTHVGYDDDMTINDAMHWLDRWLEYHTEWIESSPQTYWQPAEYTCIGIN